jgi:hypothetical protein
MRYPSYWQYWSTPSLCDNSDAVRRYVRGIAQHSATLLRTRHPPEDRQMAGPPRPWVQQVFGPDRPAHRPKADIGGRDPEGPISPQDAHIHSGHSQPTGFPGPVRTHRAVLRNLGESEPRSWRHSRHCRGCPAVALPFSWRPPRLLPLPQEATRQCQVKPPPLAHTRAAQGNANSWCFYHTCFGSRAQKCENGCTYQETRRPVVANCTASGGPDQPC